MAGGNGSAFLTRAADELPEEKPPQLLERLQSAIDAAAVPITSKDQTPYQYKHYPSKLDKLKVAVEMIFGSAAATVSAFGRKVK